ncbi:MAG: ABC transporter substrate-binding protein [Mycobacterium leprae]
MKNWHRVLAGLGTGLMLTTLVAGCGSKPADTKTAAPAASSGPVEITMWGDWSGEGANQINTMVDAFNKAQNKVQVKYVVQQDMTTKFLTAATSGTAPDVVIWDRWQTALYAPKNVLAPINDFMTKDNVPQSDFYGEALKELSYGGKLYGLPLTVDARALFYNKKFLDEAGVKPPTTWDELEKVAKATTKWNGDKLERAGMSMGDVGLFSMWLKQAGGQMLTADGTKTDFNNDKGLAVLNYWDKLINQDKVYKLGFEQGLGNNIDAFATGKVAMTYNGPWMLTTYKKYGKDLDFGVVPPPAGPNGAKASGMGGFGLVIPQASKNKDAAWSFVKWWIADPANALMWSKTSLNINGNLKAIQDPFFQNDPFWKPFLDTLAFASIRPTVAGYSPAEVNGVMPQLQLFLEGKQDAKTTLANAQKQADNLLQQNAVK